MTNGNRIQIQTESINFLPLFWDKQLCQHKVEIIWIPHISLSSKVKITLTL